MSLAVYQCGPWFVIAREAGSSFEAPMTKSGRKLTGCNAVFGSLSYCASSPNVYRYKSRAAANRKARSLLAFTL